MNGRTLSVTGRGRREARGAVTAETAVALPVLVVFTLGLVWLVSVGVAQVRVVDAARETARALARDEEQQVATALGERIAPDGSHIRVSEDAATFEVKVSTHLQGPPGFFQFLPRLKVDATAVAAKEPS